MRLCGVIGTPFAAFTTMALPVHHPLWLSLCIIIPVSIASGVLVRAHALELARGRAAAVSSRNDRSDGALAFALLSAFVGVVLSLTYVFLAGRFPAATRWLFLASAALLGTCLSVIALRLSQRMRIGGARELVALNMLWTVAYGVMLPLLLDLGTRS